MISLDYNNLLKKPLSETLFITDKDLYKIIPSILSSNKEYSQIFYSIDKFNPDIQDFFCDLAIYTFLNHYLHLSDNYQSLLSSYQISASDIRNQSKSIMDMVIPEFKNFITGVDSSNIVFNEENPDTAKTINKSINNACIIEILSNAQFLNSSFKFIVKLNELTNPNVKEKLSKLFKNIDDNFITTMMVSLRVPSMQYLKNFLSTEQNFNKETELYYPFLDVLYDNSSLNDKEISFLKFLTIYTQYSINPSKNINAFISSYNIDTINNNKNIAEFLYSIPTEHQHSLWMNDNFQKHIQQSIKNIDYINIYNLKKVFIKNAKILSELDKINVIHNDDTTLKKNTFINDDTVSYTVCHHNFQSFLVNNLSEAKILELKKNQEIDKILINILKKTISSLFDSDLFDGYSISENLSKDPRKTGQTFNFSNKNLSIKELDNFVNKIFSKIEHFILNDLVDKKSSDPQFNTRDNLEEIGMLYEEAFLLSHIKENSSTAIKKNFKF